MNHWGMPACARALCFIVTLVGATTPHLRYVIIGAGPGGLQLAHYLDSAGRDYAVLERAPGPASFFRHLPRFRQLISINKRWSGRTELDHFMRHDWNSLLSDSSHSATGSVSSTSRFLTLEVAERDGWLLFRNYSTEYYPQADALVEYLSDWTAGNRVVSTSAGHPANPLRVRYNVQVTRVRVLSSQLFVRSQPGRPLSPRFHLTLSDGSELTCTFLIMATGLQVIIVET
jgi:2-polyprenyl-6-methoxyphenol hydroxylase-like FAD-dependent oxidoreductase